MRPIPTRIHGGVDYLTALLLVASPWLFNFVRYGAETWVPLVLGAGIVVYSLCTNYECGLAPLLPMPWHLVLDAGGGLFLAASPWLLGFHDQVWAPHVCIGLFEIATAALTRTVPAYGPPTTMGSGGLPGGPDTLPGGPRSLSR